MKAGVTFDDSEDWFDGTATDAEAEELEEELEDDDVVIAT